jgi:hypothetical protein
MKKNHVFDLPVRLWPGEQGAWHFVSLPPQDSLDFKDKYQNLRRGWNSIKVEASIGKTTWNTSLFYVTKGKQYVLPLKASVRKAEDIYEGDVVRIKIKIL